MPERVLHSHVAEAETRGSLLISLAGHVALAVLLLVGVQLFEPEILQLGSGEPGAGGGGAISVGLVASLDSGGAGMVKPALQPKPEVFAPPEKKPEPEPVQTPSEPVFEQVQPKAKKEPEDWRKKPAPKKEPPRPAPTGVVPRDPEPGSGGQPGGSPGSGEGSGSGGVLVGSGDGSGGIDSWYVRQVEKRIGGNWLKTALGTLEQPVRTKISFEIAPDGEIQSVRVEETSGNSSVDLAAQRAVLASNPLPPLPFEMRRRRIKFVAFFEYPPR